MLFSFFYIIYQILPSSNHYFLVLKALDFIICCDCQKKRILRPLRLIKKNLLANKQTYHTMSKICFFFLILMLGIPILHANEIKGKVIDDKGFPLASATVKIKELQKGIMTNEEGEFNFTGLPEKKGNPRSQLCRFPNC